MRLFADDSHLCWCLEKVGDLNEIQINIAKTFALLIMDREK